MKIACISLGCPKNQVDLDGMVHILLSAGHETVADLGEADVILVNTCGFIESAKTEAIENILEACSYKQANPNLKVVVTGFGVGKLLKLDSTKCRAISIEVGMQNSGLATSLAAAHFAQYPLATIPGAVFSVWHNISGAVLANFFARTAEKKD